MTVSRMGMPKGNTPPLRRASARHGPQRASIATRRNAAFTAWQRQRPA
ncbi:hypothetical protein [Lysobacter claricitrinus]